MKKIKEQLKDELKKIDEEFYNDLNQLTANLQAITPVDTGFLKQEWTEVVKNNEFNYTLRNNAEYATHVLVDGNSKQLSMGILPHIKSFFEKKYGG